MATARPWANSTALLVTFVEERQVSFVGCSTSAVCVTVAGKCTAIFSFAVSGTAEVVPLPWGACDCWLSLRSSNGGGGGVGGGDRWTRVVLRDRWTRIFFTYDKIAPLRLQTPRRTRPVIVRTKRVTHSKHLAITSILGRTAARHARSCLRSFRLAGGGGTPA